MSHPVTHYHNARRSLAWLGRNPHAPAQEVRFHAQALHNIGRALWEADGPHCRYCACALIRVARSYGISAALAEWDEDLARYSEPALGAPWEWRGNLPSAIDEEAKQLRKSAWDRLEVWYQGYPGEGRELVGASAERLRGERDNG